MDLKRHAAREEAAQWLAKIDRGLRRGEGELLRKWLTQSVNRISIVEIARRSSGPEVLALLAELFPIGNAMTRQARRGSLVILVSAAAATGIVILGTVMLNDQRHWARIAASLSASHNSDAVPHPPLAKGSYSTLIGQQQEVLLPDGSVIRLNTDTSVVVTYSVREREIWLPRGEAGFRVAREPDRPFFVRAGLRRRLEAAGTQFDVRVLAPDNIELIVSEGTVKVFDTPMDWTEAPAIARLRANRTYDDTTIGAPGMVQLEPGLQFTRKVEASDVNDLLAWQRGRIVFKGERLEDVLTETHRYTKTRFVLSDKELSDTRVIGDFRTGDIEEFLDSLRRNYLIVSQRDPSGRIVLSRLTPPVSRL